MSAFAWNSHPFYLDQYDNKFIAYFDIVTLSLSAAILIVLCIIWIYQLYIRRHIAAMATKDSMQQSKDKNRSNRKKKKPKIDMSLPTLTVADSKTKPDSPKDDGSAAERSKTASDALSSTSQSNDSQHERQGSKDKSAKLRSIHPASKALVTTCIVTGTLFIFGLTAFCILCILYKHPSCAILCVIFELLYIQRICLYCYYFLRLYLTFESSVYAIDKRKLIRNVSILCFWWFCGCVFFYIWCVPIGDCTELNVIISIIPLAITEMCISIYCVWSFVKKVKQLHVNKKEVKEKLQYLTTKLTILATFTVFSTFSVFSIYPFTFFLGLLAIDMPINVVCLILTFGFYDKYYIILCGRCRMYIKRRRDNITN